MTGEANDSVSVPEPESPRLTPPPPPPAQLLLPPPPLKQTSTLPTLGTFELSAVTLYVPVLDAPLIVGSVLNPNPETRDVKRRWSGALTHFWCKCVDSGEFPRRRTSPCMGEVFAKPLRQ